MDAKILNVIISDLLINLSAGWIGALIIVPNYTEEKGKRKLIVLTMDISLAMISLFGAYLFRNF